MRQVSREPNFVVAYTHPLSAVHSNRFPGFDSEAVRRFRTSLCLLIGSAISPFINSNSNNIEQYYLLSASEASNETQPPDILSETSLTLSGPVCLKRGESTLKSPPWTQQQPSLPLCCEFFEPCAISSLSFLSSPSFLSFTSLARLLCGQSFVLPSFVFTQLGYTPSRFSVKDPSHIVRLDMFHFPVFLFGFGDGASRCRSDNRIPMPCSMRIEYLGVHPSKSHDRHHAGWGPSKRAWAS